MGHKIGHTFLLILESFCLALLLCVLIAGSIANFTLPYFGRGSGIGGCYFTDAMIVYVACKSGHWLGDFFSWAWMWSWGIHWQIGLLPYSLISLIPEILMIWFAIRMIRRIVTRTF